MLLKRSAHWPLVSTILGLLLLSAGAADGRALWVSGRDEDWALLVRAELELYGGLWLLSGLLPRWAWRVTVTAFAGILFGDIARIVIGLPTRPIWGRVATGSWWVPGSNLIVLGAVLRWRPSGMRTPWIYAHPGRMAGAVLIAVALGAAIDRSGFGQFPIVAKAPSRGSPSSSGLDYLVYLPEGYYLSTRRWPLILSLHGAGAVDRGLAQVRAGCVPRHVESGGRLPFIVVAPWSPQRGWDVAAIEALLDDVLGRYPVDADRVYLTGESMGGYGTWALAAAHPERFAAAAPVCGGGEQATAERMRGVLIWAFHGAEDRVVPPEESRRMVEAVDRAGGDARLTIYPGVGHDAATPTYAGPGLYRWFLSHRRGPLRPTNRSAGSRPARKSPL